jgi:phytoene synthase
MKSASKNYSFAGTLLPRNKKHHVEALYALLRVGDDRVDVSSQGFASPLEAIEDWEKTYWDALSTGSSSHPVMRAYLNTAIECGIPPETMSSYFRAMREDLELVRFPKFDDLLHYMEGSAIPVGRAMTYILGVVNESSMDEALLHADSLSIAMQLSNFWRDVREDWALGRVYIPEEDLERFGVKEKEIGEQRVTSNLQRLLAFQISRTEEYYDHARRGIRLLASGRWGVMCALEVYRAILSSIRRNGYDVYSRRAGTTRAQKIYLMIKSAWNVMTDRARPPTVKGTHPNNEVDEKTLERVMEV